MDSREFGEWMALAQMDYEDAQRAELARRAEAGLAAQRGG